MAGIILDLDGVGYRMTRELTRGKNTLYAFAAAAAATRQDPSLKLEHAKQLAKQSYQSSKSELTVFNKMGLDHNRLFHDFHDEAFQLLGHNIPRTKGLARAFAQVSQRVPIAILSHSARIWADQVLEHIGIAKQIDPNLIFTLEDPRINFVRKSHSPEPFKIVCRVMGQSPQKTIMVEDDAPNLIKAKEAGLKTALISRANTKVPSYVDAVYPSIVDFLRQYQPAGRTPV